MTALTNLGLSKTDAQVYTFLATKGPQKIEKIMEEMQLQEKPLFLSLEILRRKGVVSLKQERSALFIALPFNEALELLVKEHLEQAQVIEQSKDKISFEWKPKIGNSQHNSSEH